MARNEEKAQLMLNKWVTMKEQFNSGQAAERRPFLATDCSSLADCEKWRMQIVREVTKKVAAIQNAGLGEHKIRDLNDNINKLLREKGHWQRRIRDLGGPDYNALEPKALDAEGRPLPGGGGYRYFGAARDLPGVKELFEAPPPQKKRRTRGDMMRNVTPDYYGFRDDDDGGALKAQEAAVERPRVEEARMKELETLFDGLSAQRRGADAKGDGREFTPWRVNFPLHAAAERGDVEEIERILDKPGTPVEQTLDSIDGLERTALHYAAARGRLEIVDMLLNKGARVDLSDLSQQTALHKAAAGGHTGVCRTIVLAMADANAGDASGVTPLMLAAKSGVVECVQVLMRHGARTSETDAEGNPALAYASRDHIVLRSVLEGVRVGTGKGGDLRVDVKGSVAAAVAGDAVRTGMPVKSSGNLNLEKSEITMRLKKLVQELDNMDLKFAEGRGSAGQVFHWTYACPCRAELLIAEGGSAMLLVSQLSGDMQNQN